MTRVRENPVAQGIGPPQPFALKAVAFVKPDRRVIVGPDRQVQPGDGQPTVGMIDRRRQQRRPAALPLKVVVHGHADSGGMGTAVRLAVRRQGAHHPPRRPGDQPQVWMKIGAALLPRGDRSKGPLHRASDHARLIEKIGQRRNIFGLDGPDREFSGLAILAG